MARALPRADGCQPALAVGCVLFAPDPSQLSERRLAVHQVGTDGRNPLRQALPELHVRSGHETEVIHGAPLCQGPPSRRPIYRVEDRRPAVTPVP